MAVLWLLSAIVAGLHRVLEMFRALHLLATAVPVRLGRCMFPYLCERVVLVEGPEAFGVYDLRRGDFHRVSLSAGELLSKLDGTRSERYYSPDDREFLEDAISIGIVDVQAQSCLRPHTHLNDVIRPLRPIRFAWIELTSRCNQLCKHCFLGEDLNAYPGYSLEEVMSMLRTLDNAGARQIVFSGGEPTAHPQFNEILDEAGSKYKFKFSLLSNGSHSNLLRSIPLLKKHEVTVKIPLLGWNQSHDSMAGYEGGFRKTISAIEALVLEGVNVQLGTTVTGINYRDIPKIADYARRINLPLEISPLFAVGNVESNYKELYQIGQKEIIEICRQHSISIVEPIVEAQSSEVKPSNQARYSLDPTDYDSVDLKDYLTEHSECGQKIVAILSSRLVTPCLMLRAPEHAIGSLTTENLEEIILRRTKRSIEFDELFKLTHIQGCNSCEARFVCKAGGCPASANAFSGTVAVKNPLYRECYYYDEGRKEIDDSGRLKADLIATSRCN